MAKVQSVDGSPVVHTTSYLVSTKLASIDSDEALDIF